MCVCFLSLCSLSSIMQEEHGAKSGSTKYIIGIDGFQGVWLHFQRASLCSVQL